MKLINIYFDMFNTTCSHNMDILNGILNDSSSHYGIEVAVADQNVVFFIYHDHVIIMKNTDDYVLIDIFYEGSMKYFNNFGKNRNAFKL